MTPSLDTMTPAPPSPPASPNGHRRRRPSWRSPRARRTVLWALPLLGLAMVGMVVAALSAAPHLLAARRELTAARSDLQAARAAIGAHDTAGARSALDRSDASLNRAVGQGGGLAQRLLRPLPVIGSPVKAMAAAAHAGREAVIAGRILNDAADSFPTSGKPSIDGHDLSAFHTAAQRSTDALAEAGRHLTAASKALAGPAGAALPPVSGPARAMLRTMDDSRRQLSAAGHGLDLMSRLTAPGADARLLLLAQDSMELRATGGFIGSFGVLHFAGGTASLERYDSVSALSAPNPPMLAPEALAPALGHSPWELSNSAWWPNFPTSAANSVELFRRQGGGDVAGVVAITEHVMARLVGAVGPIQLPGYAEPVTEAGFDQRVLYEVELKNPKDEPRKKFLIELSDEVFHRLFTLAPDRLPAVVQALGHAAGAGDLQLFFTDPASQADIAGTALDGALPQVQNDFLMLVEANLSSGKANADLVRNVSYTVRPGPNGRLQASLRIEYRNDGRESRINPYYNGFLRVYVPRGSTLLENGDPVRAAVDAPDGPYGIFPRSVFVPAAGGRTVETFDYLLPKSVVQNGGYRLTWLRQAGTPADTLTATLGGRTVTADPANRRLDVAAPGLRADRGLTRLLPGL